MNFEVIPTVKSDVSAMSVAFGQTQDGAPQEVCCVVFVNGVICMYNFKDGKLLFQSDSIGAVCVLAVPPAIAKLENHADEPQAWIGLREKKGIHAIVIGPKKRKETAPFSVMYRLGMGQSEIITSLSLCGSRHLAAHGSDGKTVIWDIETRTALSTIANKNTEGHFFCMECTGAAIWGGCADGSIIVHELRSTEQKELSGFVLSRHTAAVTCLLVLNDYVLSAGEDHKVLVWDGWLCDLVHILDKHDHAVIVLCQTRNATSGTSEIWSADENNNFCIWTDDFELVRTFSLDIDGYFTNMISSHGTIWGAGTTGNILRWEQGDTTSKKDVVCSECAQKEKQLLDWETNHNEKMGVLLKRLEAETHQVANLSEVKSQLEQQIREALEVKEKAVQEAVEAANERRGAVTKQAEMEEEMTELQRFLIEKTEECEQLKEANQEHVLNKYAESGSVAEVDFYKQRVEELEDENANLRFASKHNGHAADDIEALQNVHKAPTPPKPESVRPIAGFINPVAQLIAHLKSDSVLFEAFTPNVKSLIDELSEMINGFQMTSPLTSSRHQPVKSHGTSVTPTRVIMIDLPQEKLDELQHTIDRQETEGLHLKEELAQLQQQFQELAASKLTAEVCNGSLESYTDSLLATIDCLYVDRMNALPPSTKVSCRDAIVQTTSGGEVVAPITPRQRVLPLQSPLLRDPTSPDNGMEHLLQENESLRLQLHLVEQLLRNQQRQDQTEHSVESVAPSQSSTALTACFLTIKDVLGPTVAGRVVLDALKGDVTDEINAIERLILSICTYFRATANVFPHQTQSFRQDVVHTPPASMYRSGPFFSAYT